MEDDLDPELKAKLDERIDWINAVDGSRSPTIGRGSRRRSSTSMQSTCAG
jgi:hypothetical protein